MVFSPLSINAVLGMIAAGSTGRTQEEVLEYFKAKSCDELNTSVSQLAKVLLADGPCLKSANGVWVDQRFTLKPSYKDILHNVYKVDAGKADFLNKAEEERGKLNMWAEERTNGLIKEVLEPGSINSYTKLVFGNAVYFRGVWDSHFDESKDYDFFLLNGRSIKLPFMTNYERQYVSTYDGFKVLRLPYEQDGDQRRFSMYIYLPYSRDGLTSLVERATSEPGFIKNHIPCEKVKLSDFLIPKFEICSKFDVSKVLKKQGVVSAFEGGLTEMVEENDENLFVSDISHKAVIKVNEKGTEAAAVTLVDAQLSACEPRFEEKVEDFVADHPFLFVIREDNTGTVLFIGQVLDPMVLDPMERLLVISKIG